MLFKFKLINIELKIQFLSCNSHISRPHVVCGYILDGSNVEYSIITGRSLDSTGLEFLYTIVLCFLKSLVILDVGSSLCLRIPICQLCFLIACHWLLRVQGSWVAYWQLFCCVRAPYSPSPYLEHCSATLSPAPWEQIHRCQLLNTSEEEAARNTPGTTSGYFESVV